MCEKHLNRLAKTLFMPMLPETLGYNAVQAYLYAQETAFRFTPATAVNMIGQV